MTLTRIYATVFAAMTGFAAQAHPHVYIDARAGFLFDEAGQLSALRITWTYDAFTSLALLGILDLDQDGDGVLTEADRALLITAQTIWPEDYHGDTYLEAGGESIPLTRPENGRAEMEEGLISVGFDLPLAAPLDPAQDVVLRLYDPTYYYAYTTVGVKDMALPHCTAEVIPFSLDEAGAQLKSQLAALSREETPDQPDVGRVFSDKVALTCG